MKVLTFQSSKVLDEVLKNGICYPIKNIRFPHAPKTYEHIISDYNEKKNTSCEALFYVWVKVFEDEELCINDDHTERCWWMTPFYEDTKVLLLEVPDDLVLVTSFYNYTDMMQIEEGEHLNREWDWIYDLENAPCFEQQGLISHITKDMIIDYKDAKPVRLHSFCN